MAKKNKAKPPDQVSKKPSKLNEMDIQVNELGQIERNFDIDKINQFLNENVPDKKFSDEK
ncbi:MAG: hypothetical protein KDC65_03435 [Saprospiraceae bacterium]|nr:hypothetical protein [Saprospiraceae bacterium]